MTSLSRLVKEISSDINDPEKLESVAKGLTELCAYKSEYYGGSPFTTYFSEFARRLRYKSAAMKVIGLVFEKMCNDWRAFHLYDLIDLTDHAINRHLDDIDSVIKFFDKTEKFRRSRAIRESVARGIEAEDTFGPEVKTCVEKRTRFLRKDPIIQEAMSEKEEEKPVIQKQVPRVKWQSEMTEEELAEEAEWRKRVEEAKAINARGVEVPEEFREIYAMGIDFETKGKLVEALEKIEAALELHPTHVGAMAAKRRVSKGLERRKAREKDDD